MKVSIVIPALNEEGVVGRTVRSIPREELKKRGLDVEILVVDNASIDNTANEAAKAGARVVKEAKRGYGNAYLRGFREASGEIIVMGDADGTYPLEKTHEFIKPILDGKADFVIGSRLKGKIHPGAMPFMHQHIGNPLLTSTLRLLFQVNISDAHCGMRAFTRNALKKMDLKAPGMEFASEMVIEAGRKKLRIAEIPIEYRPRGGVKKLNTFRDGWRHLRFMMLYSPTVIFLIPGTLLFLLGALLIGLLIKGPYYFSNMGLDIHPMVLGNLLVILGVQIIILGIFTKVLSVLRGINPPGRFIGKLMRYNSLEYGLLIGAVLFLTGLIVDVKIILDWITAGFGALYELRNAIVASTLMFLGAQLMFSALFLSVLLLGRKTGQE